MKVAINHENESEHDTENEESPFLASTTKADDEKKIRFRHEGIKII